MSAGRVTTKLLPAALVLVAFAIVAGVYDRRTHAPDEASYRANNLGVAQLERFDFDGAAQSFRRALEIDPRLTLARLNLAIALLHAGKPEDAEANARQAVAAMPDSPSASFVLGLILRALNRSEDAIPAFARVVALDPDDAGAAVNLGQILQEQRKYPEAVAQFTRAVGAEPYNVTAAYGLATSLARADRDDDSAAAMKRFTALRDTPYATSFSQSYLEQGRYAVAISSTGLERELVDERTPAVTFRDATAKSLGAEAGGRCVALALADLDADGDLDLVLLSTDRVTVLANERGRFRRTSAMAIAGTRPGALAVGDLDNDGRPDIFVSGDPENRLFGQRADGSFGDLTAAAAFPASSGARRAIALLDADHDGDLDIAIGDPLQLLRNNGNGTFTDIASEAGLHPAVRPIQAIVGTDFDDRRDVDVLVMPAGAPALYRNLRDGRFEEVATAVGLPPADDYSAVAAGDVNKDELTDFFFARRNAPGVFVTSRGVDRFQTSTGPDETTGATAVMLVDYDNDGVLDLVAMTPTGPRLWRHAGDKWIDASPRAFAAETAADGDALVGLAVGDLDGDGDADIVARTAAGALRVLVNDGGNTNRSLSVGLAARVSNRSAIGAKVDLRAGSLRQRLEVSVSSPPVRPSDVVFGLGRRSAADVVRVLWPAGILQAEISPRTPLTIAELDRKPSSCPFLYTWNGSQFEFVTDFLGGGEMGDWVAPDTWSRPDPDEYVRIRNDQLHSRDGNYELRITNELEEVMFLDRVELVAVDHPAGVAVFPNEGLRATPDPFRLFTIRAPKLPVTAVDDHGHDVSDLIQSMDHRYPDDFVVSSIRGYAETHTLTLDLGQGSDRARLLLTGWTDYAFSSDNVAAHQAGVALRPPALQVRDESGTWRTVDDDIGFPTGRPQTLVIDLKGKFLGPSREVRIVTNMRVYWDQILVDRSGEDLPVRITRSPARTATLSWRGFSIPVRFDGRAPERYDYGRVTGTAPWKAFTGRYTREGDVRPLLETSDDRFVIAMPGDEIAVAFDTAAFPPMAAGQSRTFLLYADGFSKEMNLRSASPDRLQPLPFHGMTRYPYGAGESVPSAPEYRDYLARYNTRVIARSVPSIDGALANGVRR